MNIRAYHALILTLQIYRCNVLEIRRFSARNWPIMRWIVYGYLVIVMQ